MSVESSKRIRSSEEGLQSQDLSIRSPTRRVSPPKKSLALKLWDLLQPLARLWGLVTAVVNTRWSVPLTEKEKLRDGTLILANKLVGCLLSGAGAELMVLGYEVAPGFLVGAALVFLLETMWVVALFVDLLCRRGEYTHSLRCWDLMRWSCGRARAPFYACAATAILFANLTLLAAVAGGLLLGLAALRAAVPFSPYASHGPHSPRAGSSLLSQYDSPLPDVFYNPAHSNDDRCEEMTVLKENTPEKSRSVTPKPPLLEL